MTVFIQRDQALRDYLCYRYYHSFQNILYFCFLNELEIYSDKMMIEVLEPCICDLIITSYEGDVDKIDGTYSGQGSAKLDNNCVYEGEFRKGMPHGQGVFTWPNEVSYAGSFNNGIMDGRGSYNWPDGSVYDGEIKNGKRHGNGIFTCSSDQTYEGEWK